MKGGMGAELVARRGGFGGFGVHGEWDLPWPLFVGLAVPIVVVVLICDRYQRRRAAASANRIAHVWRQVEAELGYRRDLVGHLLAAVGGVAGDDPELERVGATHAWVGTRPPAGPVQRQQTEEIFAGAIDRLLALVWRHPVLTRDARIADIVEHVHYADGRVATGVRYYNAKVRDYNRYIERHRLRREFSPAEHFNPPRRTRRPSAHV